MMFWNDNTKDFFFMIEHNMTAFLSIDYKTGSQKNLDEMLRADNG